MPAAHHPRDYSWAADFVAEGQHYVQLRNRPVEPGRALTKMVKVRLLQEGDEIEWLRLRVALWPDQTVDELRQELLVIAGDRERQPVFVAERPEGNLCGFVEAAIRTNAPGCVTQGVGFLEGWFVEPEWRGQGIGRRLVEAAEAWARSKGCREMASDTTVDYPDSPAAHARLGYTIAARLPDGDICFRKDL